MNYFGILCKTFFADLVLVRVYKHPRVDDIFKYRPINSDDVKAKDPQNLDDWRRPDQDGNLKSIKIYATESFFLNISVERRQLINIASFVN